MNRTKSDMTKETEPRTINEIITTMTIEIIAVIAIILLMAAIIKGRYDMLKLEGITKEETVVHVGYPGVGPMYIMADDGVVFQLRLTKPIIQDVISGGEVYETGIPGVYTQDMTCLHTTVEVREFYYEEVRKGEK